jgi:hypothetical protein
LYNTEELGGRDADWAALSVLSLPNPETYWLEPSYCIVHVPNSVPTCGGLSSFKKNTYVNSVSSLYNTLLLSLGGLLFMNLVSFLLSTSSYTLPQVIKNIMTDKSKWGLFFLRFHVD